MSQITDIATLRELTSNSSNSLDVYLHTDKARMRDAMKKMEKQDISAELEQIFDKVIAGEFSRKKFVETVKNLVR